MLLESVLYKDTFLDVTNNDNLDCPWIPLVLPMGICHIDFNKEVCMNSSEVLIGIGIVTVLLMAVIGNA